MVAWKYLQLHNIKETAGRCKPLHLPSSVFLFSQQSCYFIFNSVPLSSYHFSDLLLTFFDHNVNFHIPIKTSNKNVRLGLWHLQFSLQLAFWHNVLNDCVIIVLEKKKIDSLRWTNWQEGKNSAKTDLEGILLDRNLLFFMVGVNI